MGTKNNPKLYLGLRAFMDEMRCKYPQVWSFLMQAQLLTATEDELVFGFSSKQAVAYKWMSKRKHKAILKWFYGEWMDNPRVKVKMLVLKANEKLEAGY